MMHHLPSQTDANSGSKEPQTSNGSAQLQAAQLQAVDVNQTFTFTHSDFTWTYATGTPPADANLSPALAALAVGKYGYNDAGNLGVQPDRLNASFFNDAFFENGTDTESVTFHKPGDTASFRFGTGALIENVIVSRPIGTPGAEDFSYPYDPSHPEELKISIDVNVLGIPLHFVSIPQVDASPQLSLIKADPSSPYNGEVQGLSRTGPPNAPQDLPGGFHDPNRFIAHFNSEQLEIGNNKYFANISDLKFDAYKDPSTPAVTYPGTINPHNPIDFTPAIFTMTLESTS